jgi:signal transduction histidine kinase
MRRRARTAEERLERLLSLQSLLARVTRDLGPATDLQAVLTTVLDGMRSLVDFRGGSVCLLENGEIRIAAADPQPSEEVLAARLAVGEGLAGRVVSSGLAVYSPDLDADARVDPELRRLGSNAQMRSYLAVPLVCLGWNIGLIQVDAEEADAFDQDDLALLEGLATQVAGAIESARRYEQVIELERLKADFMGRVSHELRTPLTIIAGFATTLIAHEERLDGTQRREMLERIDAAAERLEVLIDELLTVTGFEAGVMVPTPVDVDVAEVLQAVVTDLINEIRADAPDPARLMVQCQPGLRLWVDQRLLRHGVRLLVDNALKYGTRATITGTTTEAGGVRIEVVDDGPGVPSEQRERIFERFTRGPGETRPGMGLGLPLVRLLAGGLGARVEVDDGADGTGAVFRLVFPPPPPPDNDAPDNDGGEEVSPGVR